MPGAQELEGLVSAAVVLEPDDLRGMAELHGEIVRLGQEFAEAGQGAISAQAIELSQALERVILAEVPDAAQALRVVVEGLAGLRAAAESGGGGEPVGAATEPEAKQAAWSVETVNLEEHAVAEVDLPFVREFVREASEHIGEAERGLLELEADPSVSETINTVFRSFHSMKGGAGCLQLRQIAAVSHVTEGLLDAARKGRLALRGEAMEAVLSAVDACKALVGDVASAVSRGEAPGQLPGVRELLARLEGVLQGQPAPAAAAEAAPVRSETLIPEPVAARAGPVAAAGSGGAAHAIEDTVKVSTERLDQLINMVGELVIAESMVARDCAASSGLASNLRLTRNLGQLAKITRELQELSMSLRMVPVHGMFQKMSRLVRDTARKLEKDVSLHLEGGDTELDRGVVDALSDPLVHMVRNALDHGVEKPDAREAAGKPRTARVSLRARHEAGHVVIDIADDGKGIDAARVLKKARDAGIVSPHQQLPDAEVYRLIFHPGLSTAEKVTDVSGRGVGMDVVKKNVEKLRGRIDIASTPGHGSTFTLRLPLTLAVIDGLLVSVGKHTYIIPVTSVEKNLRPTPEQLPTAFGRGEMCNIRGSLIPLVRLHRVFEVEPEGTDPSKSLVVIVHDEARRCGVLVDRLLGQQQVVIKSLGYGASGVQGIAGGAILGDGNVSLILDVPGILDLATHDQARKGA